MMAQILLKFGFHNFLNAQPVVVPLCRRARDAGFAMVFDVPGALAERLAAGVLDLAMIPAIEYLKRAQEYRLVPGLSIASRGPVGTVLLVSGKPLGEAARVAVDERSRTSVALLKILFGDLFPPGVHFSPLPPDVSSMFDAHDAALIIGDQALRIDRNDPALRVWDLSEEWFARTEKTFVHAVVAVRPEVKLTRRMLDTIEEAKAQRGDGLKDIVRVRAEQMDLPAGTIRDYLEHQIIYDLGEEELAGLRLFQQIANECGLVDRAFPLRFIGE